MVFVYIFSDCIKFNSKFSWIIIRLEKFLALYIGTRAWEIFFNYQYSNWLIKLVDDDDEEEASK